MSPSTLKPAKARKDVTREADIPDTISTSTNREAVTAAAFVPQQMLVKFGGQSCSSCRNASGYRAVPCDCPLCVRCTIRFHKFVTRSHAIRTARPVCGGCLEVIFRVQLTGQSTNQIASWDNSANDVNPVSLTSSTGTSLSTLSSSTTEPSVPPTRAVGVRFDPTTYSSDSTIAPLRSLSEESGALEDLNTLADSQRRKVTMSTNDLSRQPGSPRTSSSDPLPSLSPHGKSPRAGGDAPSNGAGSGATTEDNSGVAATASSIQFGGLSTTVPTHQASLEGLNASLSEVHSGMAAMPLGHQSRLDAPHQLFGESSTVPTQFSHQYALAHPFFGSQYVGPTGVEPSGPMYQQFGHFQNLAGTASPQSIAQRTPIDLSTIPMAPFDTSGFPVGLEGLQNVGPNSLPSGMIGQPMMSTYHGLESQILAPQMSLPQVQSGPMNPLTSLYNAMMHLPFVECGKLTRQCNWGVVKITNAPWAVTKQEILAFLGRNAKIINDNQGYPIHVITDRTTSKVYDVFVEFETQEDAIAAVERHRRHEMAGHAGRLGDRHVSIQLTEQAELMKALFPKARNVQWRGVDPFIVPSSEWHNSGFKQFVTTEELILAVKLSDNPLRSPARYKGLPRTFEFMVSTLMKFPWWATKYYSLGDRDALFETARTMITLLDQYLKKPDGYTHANEVVFNNLVWAACNAPGFCDSQRADILKVAGWTEESLGMGNLCRWWSFKALTRRSNVPESMAAEYAALLKSASPTGNEPSPFGKFYSLIPWPHNVKDMSMEDVAELELQTVNMVLRRVFHVDSGAPAPPPSLPAALHQGQDDTEVASKKKG